MLISGANAMAANLISIDFESETVGATPSVNPTPAAGVLVTQVASVFETAAGGSPPTNYPATTVRVSNNFTDGYTNVVMPSNVLVLTDQRLSGGTPNFALLLNNADAPTSGVVSLSFDWLQLNTLPGGTVGGVKEQGNGTVYFKNMAGAIMETISLSGDGSAAVPDGMGGYTWLGDAAPIKYMNDAAVYVTLSPRATEGLMHHIIISLDMTANTFMINMDGSNLLASPVAMSSAAAATDLSYIQFAPGSTYAGIMGFDNIVLTPEPATMALLGLGGLLFARKRK